MSNGNHLCCLLPAISNFIDWTMLLLISFNWPVRFVFQWIIFSDRVDQHYCRFHSECCDCFQLVIGLLICIHRIQRRGMRFVYYLGALLSYKDVIRWWIVWQLPFLPWTELVSVPEVELSDVKKARRVGWLFMSMYMSTDGGRSWSFIRLDILAIRRVRCSMAVRESFSLASVSSRNSHASDPRKKHQHSFHVRVPWIRSKLSNQAAQNVDVIDCLNFCLAPIWV